MAITTLDGAIAGMQPPRQIVKALSGTLVAGRPFSYWGSAGFPAAGTYDTTLNGAILTGNAVQGQIPRANPSSGNAYLARFVGTLNNNASIMLCDRLWQNRPANASGAQAITSPTWPARSIDGTTNGDGVLLGLEFSTAQSAGTATCTVTYTNQAGTGSRSATLADAITATTAINSFLRFNLDGADTGIRSIQSVNFSATSTGGVWNLVAYRPIAMLDGRADIPAVVDVLTGGMPRLYDGTVPFVTFVSTATASTTFVGSYIETHG